MARINTRYKPGSGDAGYSQILGKLSGDRIQYIELRKDDPACFVSADCQELSLLIDEILIQWQPVSEGLADELEYLRENAYCFGGFSFLLGNSAKNVFPDDYLSKLDNLIELYNSQLDNAPDFVQRRKHLLVVRLNQLNEIVRKVERHFVTWQYHSEVVKSLYELIATEPERAIRVGHDILYMLAILNRLSKFLFAAARHENMLLGLPESYWQAQITA